MIYVNILSKDKNTGKYKSETKSFYNRIDALRFMYMMKHKGYFIDGWSCDDEYDNEWLGRKFKQ